MVKSFKNALFGKESVRLINQSKVIQHVYTTTSYVAGYKWHNFRYMSKGFVNLILINLWELNHKITFLMFGGGK